MYQRHIYLFLEKERFLRRKNRLLLTDAVKMALAHGLKLTNIKGTPTIGLGMSMSGTECHRNYFQQLKRDYQNTWQIFFIKCRVWWSFRNSYPYSPCILWQNFKTTHMWWKIYRKKRKDTPCN